MLIYLYGHLKKLSDTPIKVKSNRFDGIYHALCSLIPDFRKEFRESKQYSIVAKTGDAINHLSEQDLQFPINAESIHLIPDIDGSGIEAALIAWGMSAAAAAVTATIVTNVLISVAVGFVVSAISPKPKIGGAGNSAEKKESFYFNGATNVTDPGTALPIVYGEFITGSVVASIGLETTDLYVPPQK